MKKCYGLRSKGIHGDVIKENQVDELAVKSKFLDDICRIMAVKIYTDAEFREVLLSNEKLDKYFIEALFTR